MFLRFCRFVFVFCRHLLSIQERIRLYFAGVSIFNWWISYRITLKYSVFGVRRCYSRLIISVTVLTLASDCKSCNLRSKLVVRSHLLINRAQGLFFCRLGSIFVSCWPIWRLGSFLGRNLNHILLRTYSFMAFGSLSFTWALIYITLISNIVI